jgi:hypothetical protein
MGKLATALVVKYRGGYLEVVSGDATYGRREALVSLDVGSDEQATIIATQILTLLAADDTRYSVEIFPTVAAPTTRPVFGFNLLDYISTPNADLQANAFRRVTGITYAQDDDGIIGFVPDMGPLGELAEEELQRAIRRMLIGSLVGATDAFAPTAVRTSTPEKHDPALQPMIFNYPGALAASIISARWYVRRPAVATKITYSLQTAGTSTTTVTLLKNGSTWQTLSGLTTGVNKADAIISQLLAKDDYIQATVTTAGTGAADLTVQVDVANESSPPAD